MLIMVVGKKAMRPGTRTKLQKQVNIHSRIYNNWWKSYAEVAVVEFHGNPTLVVVVVHSFLVPRKKKLGFRF